MEGVSAERRRAPRAATPFYVLRELTTAPTSKTWVLSQTAARLPEERTACHVGWISSTSKYRNLKRTAMLSRTNPAQRASVHVKHRMAQQRKKATAWSVAGVADARLLLSRSQGTVSTGNSNTQGTVAWGAVATSYDGAATRHGIVSATCSVEIRLEALDFRRPLRHAVDGLGEHYEDEAAHTLVEVLHVEREVPVMVTGSHNHTVVTRSHGPGPGLVVFSTAMQKQGVHRGHGFGVASRYQALVCASRVLAAFWPRSGRAWAGTARRAAPRCARQQVAGAGHPRARRRRGITPYS